MGSTIFWRVYAWNLLLHNIISCRIESWERTGNPKMPEKCASSFLWAFHGRNHFPTGFRVQCIVAFHNFLLYWEFRKIKKFDTGRKTCKQDSSYARRVGSTIFRRVYVWNLLLHNIISCCIERSEWTGNPKMSEKCTNKFHRMGLPWKEPFCGGFPRETCSCMS